MPTTVAAPASAPTDDGHEVVEPLGDPDRLGPRLRDAQPDDVADEDAEDAEVEQRAADAQQPVLVELRGPGGPAELVVAVAPASGRRRRRSGRRRERPPTGARSSAAPPGNDGIGSGSPAVRPSPPARAELGVANGARPTSSSGGPSAASRRTASRSSPRSGGSVAHTASHAPAPTASRRRAATSRSSSRPARWSSSSSRPQSLVDGGGELQHDAQVVGQLGVVELEARSAGRSA